LSAKNAKDMPNIIAALHWPCGWNRIGNGQMGRGADNLALQPGSLNN
jgi:hypothetical protein